MTSTTTTATDRAIAACEAEYGPVVSVTSTTPGHAAPRDDGTCPTCGLIAVSGPTYDRDTWLRNPGSVCFEEAAAVVDLKYRNEAGRVWSALYGVPTVGPAVCWAS